MLSRTLSLLLTFLVGYGIKAADDTSQAFSFERNFSSPGDPVFVYDHLTGDISDWRDHYAHR